MNNNVLVCIVVIAIGIIYLIAKKVSIGGVEFWRWRDYLDKATFNGKMGENYVSTYLYSLSSHYRIFNDVYIKNGEYSTQIDHVIVSCYGIFVLETKNYKGNIYGTDNSEYWKQYIYSNEYTFYNPIKQNYSHVKSLSKFLYLPQKYFIPVVVFTEESDLKCKTTQNVIYANQIKDFISCYTKPILSKEDALKIIDKLKTLNVKDYNEKKEHINNVRQHIRNKNELISNRICPRCKGKLIEKKGKYGWFLSCENYPNCTFSHNL